MVNLRAGQDSGFFFFFETIAAIAYAADNDVDVVNMSFYTDPWLYSCDSADDIVEGDVTDGELAQQAMIREGIIDAVNYARGNGVTLVAAAGNQHTDLAAPTRFDDTSPDYPLGTAKPLTVTNDCLDLPSEAPGVIQVSSIGPSKIKADYSTWGLGAIDVAAPGGWFRDYFGTQDFMEPVDLDPDTVYGILTSTASDTPCPMGLDDQRHHAGGVRRRHSDRVHFIGPHGGRLGDQHPGQRPGCRR